jgi:hypothetical protein
VDRKALMYTVFLLAIVVLLPIGTSFAAKPVDVTAVLSLDAVIVDERYAGSNYITERELEGSISGDFEGIVEKYSSFVSNQLLKSVNGPVDDPAFIATAQEVITVTDAVVTVDGVVAEGSFVIGAWGHPANLKWTILSSDLTVDGEPVKMYGQGRMIITDFSPIDATHYGLEQTLEGQIGLAP